MYRVISYLNKPYLNFKSRSITLPNYKANSNENTWAGRIAFSSVRLLLIYFFLLPEGKKKKKKTYMTL